MWIVCYHDYCISTHTTTLSHPNTFLFVGQYEQNVCKANSTTCAPCPERLPSCVGEVDGLNAFPGKLWQNDYIQCYLNRTIHITKCQNGYFNPNKKRCSSIVQMRKFTYIWYNHTMGNHQGYITPQSKF